MARISGVDIPRDKRVEVSLSYIYGIGRPTALKISSTAHIAVANKQGHMTERKTRPRRREKKNIPVGRAYIASTFNNTVITLTDPNGAVISWASAGTAGFKGSRKRTPHAAGLAAGAGGRPG